MTPRDEWHLPTRRLGRRVLIYPVLDSTNTQAAALADDCGNDGLVIIADRQTAGRGQHGRTWLCAPGAGVLLSVLVFPAPALRRPALLTAWAAVSVCQTIAQLTGLQGRIKWPNDVLVGARKVCGILIEQGRGTVVGIGLNVQQSAAELAELPQAGSLVQLSGQSLETESVARELILQLDAGYDELGRGDGALLEQRWQERLDLLGKRVVADCHGRTQGGVLRRLSWDALELETPIGTLIRLAPEEVRQLSGVELPPKT